MAARSTAVCRVLYIRQYIGMGFIHMKQFILGIFERVGLRRRIMYLSYINWEQVDWNAIFKANVWMRILYAFDEVRLDVLFKRGDAEAANAIAASVNVENYGSISYDGFYLWALSKTAILGALQRTVVGEISETELEIIRHFYRQTVLCLTGAQKIMDERSPSVLLACQGCPHVIRPVVEEARRRGMITVAAEGSFHKDYFYCDNLTGMIINRHSGSRVLGDWLPTRVLTDAQRQEVRRFVATLGQSKRKQHLTDGIRSAEEIRQFLKIPEDRKIAVFIGQVMTDASIIMDSPIFPDPLDLINRTVRFFESKPDWILVIRLHPKESTGGFRVANDKIWTDLGMPIVNGFLLYNDATLKRIQSLNLQENECVRIVAGQDVNTSALLDMADMGITCNSQAGFEMILRYKSVVVAGDAFYARKGFSFDVGHESALEGALDYAVSHPVMSVACKMKVDRFLYYLVNTCLFSRALNGKCERLLLLFEGGCSLGLRNRLLQRALQNVRSDTSLHQDVE